MFDDANYDDIAINLQPEDNTESISKQPQITQIDLKDQMSELAKQIDPE